MLSAMLVVYGYHMTDVDDNVGGKITLNEM